MLSVQVMRVAPGLLSQVPLQGLGGNIVQTAMSWPFALYEVNFQFFWPTAPTRSITKKPNSCENANALTTVFGAGRSVFGLNVDGNAVSRLSPPFPATKVAGWLLEKSNAWKSCTWPCIAIPMFAG